MIMMNSLSKRSIVSRNALTTFVFAVIFAGFLISCTKNIYVKVPPGQAKKATGAKSAKQYAPGQRKKH
jgi:hypothetical protein